MDKLNSLFKYLGERPLILKLIDMVLVLIVAFGISTAYILATNFHELFLSDAEIEYNQFKSAIESNKQINTILDKLRAELGADRVGIFQFHDGTMGLGSLHFFYYSQTFESIAPGVSSVLNDNQRISISIDPTITKMANDTPFMFDEHISEATPLGHYLISQGVDRYYRAAIHTLDGTFVGFIMVEFHNPGAGDINYIRTLLERYSNAVSGILSTQ